MSQRKLLRSNTNKMIAGVCGGIADYIGVDATVIRVIWALLCLAFGGGLIAYLICALLIPSEDTSNPYQ